MTISLLLKYSAFTFCVSGYVEKEAKRFTVNLDIPPMEKWKEVILANRVQMEFFILITKLTVPDISISYFEKIKNQIRLPFPYNEELYGISSLLNKTSFHEVLLV